MNLQQKLDILKSTKGKVFTVEFTKADGSHRVMNCRLGVVKHLRGGKDTKAHIDKYVNVFDMQKGAYRSLNLETLKVIRTGEAEIKFG